MSITRKEIYKDSIKLTWISKENGTEYIVNDDWNDLFYSQAEVDDIVNRAIHDGTFLGTLQKPNLEQLYKELNDLFRQHQCIDMPDTSWIPKDQFDSIIAKYSQSSPNHKVGWGVVGKLDDSQSNPSFSPKSMQVSSLEGGDAHSDKILMERCKICGTELIECIAFSCPKCVPMFDSNMNRIKFVGDAHKGFFVSTCESCASDNVCVCKCHGLCENCRRKK